MYKPGILEIQKSNIPGLHDSLITMTDEEKERSEEEDEKKSVSIKGVKKDVYQRMMHLARESGKTLGEITNDAYRTFISTVDGARHVSQSFIDGARGSKITSIENIRNLTLSKKDLEEIGHPVDIRNIDDLTLEGLDNDGFEKYVRAITGVRNLTIPKGLSKSKVLIRARFVDNIVQGK